MRPIAFVYISLVLLLSGCYSVSLNSKYNGPQQRTEELHAYYRQPEGYGPIQATTTETHSDYRVSTIRIMSSLGEIVLDFYQAKKPGQNLILVFPILKGKPLVERYFARYFVTHGFDSAIISRQNDFLEPKNSDNLEQTLRENVMRDRLVMDFFEDYYDKRNFGSFGISRGAVNAAVTAGVDLRLKHNVFVLGGSDLPKLFEKSNQKRIRSYVSLVAANRNISNEQFFDSLRDTIQSDPKKLASHIDARHTLMILGVFDRTVPFRYGRQLREQIGRPKTIFLLADHYASLAFTQVACAVLAIEPVCFFMPDYIESEALSFFQHSMETPATDFKLWIYRAISAPFQIVGAIAEKLFED